MFIGHWAPAFAAAAVTPESPRLGTLFVAAQLVDWAFMALVLVGAEDLRVVPGITAMNPLDLYHMPYTHSLIGTAIFAAMFGILVGRTLRNAVAGTWVAIVVASHWPLDLAVHRPDLTLAGGETKYGWGLWNFAWIEMPLELAITLAAFAGYMRATRGPMGPPLILIAVMLAFQAVNWFGPEPTRMSAFLPLTSLIAFGAVTALAVWVGRTRLHKRQSGLAMARPRR